MSRENVEIWRANIEGQLAELTAGTSPEATISQMAEIWDPEIELDATEAERLRSVRHGSNRYGARYVSRADARIFERASVG